MTFSLPATQQVGLVTLNNGDPGTAKAIFNNVSITNPWALHWQEHSCFSRGSAQKRRYVEKHRPVCSLQTGADAASATTSVTISCSRRHF